MYLLEKFLDLARTARNICAFGPQIWIILHFLKRNISKNIMEATFEFFIEQDIIFKILCTLWHTWIRHPYGTHIPDMCAIWMPNPCMP